MPAHRDPVEDQYPRRVLCPACKTRHPVHWADEHSGKIIEHKIIDAQLSDDMRYSCTIKCACPGSLARVSKWKRIQ